ncbi:hypothetical protein JV46_09600 [Solemya velum gill symbiont]|uniref:Uncharacterized protein n=1 Tax=Solemya velum gill symbiont TaxID=2340 RepID=A0A0B0HCD5_SOVGS|nr:hypothetical protein JV46_09600 [Solemya velum gill symbiont]
MMTGNVCLNPEASALETVANTPGPGVMANRNMASASPNVLMIVIEPLA